MGAHHIAEDVVRLHDGQGTLKQRVGHCGTCGSLQMIQKYIEVSEGADEKTSYYAGDFDELNRLGWGCVGTGFQ